ncbi:MAG: hypothetical protein QOE01_14 [Actinomycetota bacterium]|nr:hypothetical protein [Actinomycetota bacterium]
MSLVLVVVVLAVLAVSLGGPAMRVSLPRLIAVRLLVAAALIELITDRLAGGSAPARVVALVLEVLLVALFLVANGRVTGVPLIALGLLCNVAVVVANGAMPVSVSAATRSGVARADLHLSSDPLREPITSGTRLHRLGDTVPVALPWHPQAVSPGDLLVAAGAGLLVLSGAMPPARRRRQPASRVERSTVLDRESTTRGSYS